MDEATRTALKQRLMKEESCRLHPYEDTEHVLTIGWGRNLTDNGISQSEADMMFENDLKGIVAACETNVPGFADLDETRKLVLADMAYNLGLHGLLEFKKMLAAVKAKNWPQAAAEMRNSKWAKQIPHRAGPLAEIMEKGVGD